MLARLQQYLQRDTAGPIGLEIALRAVHLVQLTQVGAHDFQCPARTRFEFSGNRQALLDDHQRLTNLLREAYGAAKFQGRKVVAAVPPELVRIMSVNYRIGANESHAEVITNLLRQRMNSDMSEYVVDFTHVRTRDLSEERLAVVALARREVVIRLLDAIRAANLHPEALEISPIAIRRAVVALGGPGHDANCLAINFGLQASYLSIISGRRLLSDQSSPVGETPIINELATLLKLPEKEAHQLALRVGVAADKATAPADAEVARIIARVVRRQLQQLVTEIERSQIYVASESRGASLSVVYLLGGIARWPGIETMLGELTDIPVQILDPRLIYGSVDDAPLPAGTVATGLALRAYEL